MPTSPFWWPGFRLVPRIHANRRSWRRKTKTGGRSNRCAAPPCRLLHVNRPSGCATPVDAFILAKLRDKGVQPSPEADRRTLIRRLTFDLHGLPPTPEEVEAFAADKDPQAYEKLVDRLLASPRYGERWARHWLDVVHFADTHGFEQDLARPNAWRYRDYVIASFNRDTPWPRFIREQIGRRCDVSGELRGARRHGIQPALSGREHARNLFRGRHEILDETRDATMAVFMGLHRLCPLPQSQVRPHPQADYYGCRPSSPASARARWPTMKMRT